MTETFTERAEPGHDEIVAVDMADLPVQHPRDPAGPAQARARFFNSGNAFNIKLPPVPGRVFSDEAARALAPDAPTGLVACDQSPAMACPFPATTPLMLARYATIAAGETLATDFAATGTIAFVIAGTGETRCGGETLRWGPGDVMLLPGGPVEHAAGSRAVLWLVGNEPQLAHDASRPPAEPVAPVHYPAAEIERQLALIFAATSNAATSGLALIFSSDGLEAGRNILPTLTLSLNTLPAGTHQRAHRHNSAAITLAVTGEACFSTVGGARCDWTPWATLVTPPGAPHSHHNHGGGRARFLIVQDGGLHYHARTMGFSFLEEWSPGGMIAWRSDRSRADAVFLRCSASRISPRPSSCAQRARFKDKPGLSMLRRLYEWILALAARPSAPYALGAVSFAESSFFPVPPDVMMVPMMVSRPDRAYRYALIATLTSVVGGLVGYAIGALLYDSVGSWLFRLYGLDKGAETFREAYAHYGHWVILLKGFTPIPYKLVTITSGFAGYDLFWFVVLSLITRGARFYLLAFLVGRYGVSIRTILDRHLNVVAGLFAAVLVLGFVAFRYML